MLSCSLFINLRGTFCLVNAKCGVSPSAGVRDHLSPGSLWEAGSRIHTLAATYVKSASAPASVGADASYLPIQNVEKMRSNISSGVVSPVISPSDWIASSRSMLMNSGDASKLSRNRSIACIALRKLSF